MKRRPVLVFWKLALVFGAVSVAVTARAVTPVEAGRVWISMAELAKKFSLEERREGLSGRIILSGESLEIVLCPGMRLARLNGKTVMLKDRVRYQGEKVLLPAEILAEIADARFASRIIIPLLPRHRSEPERLKVVIDAGHGGRDPGAIGPTGITEKQVNLAISRKLARLLEAEGIDVVLTREHDRYISLAERSNIANRAQPDLFISIHANSTRLGYVSGCETYYLPEEFVQSRAVDDFVSADSRRYHGYASGGYDDNKRALAASKYYLPPMKHVGNFSGDAVSRMVVWNMLLEQYRRESRKLAQAIQRQLSRALNVSDRGVKTEAFSVLKWTYAPAVLVEVGFLSNPLWERLLASSSIQESIASALCRAVMEVAGRRTPSAR